MVLQPEPANRIAVVPLVGNQTTDEAYALGALLSTLLGNHLRAAGMAVVPSPLLVRRLLDDKRELPLDADGIQAIKAHFKLSALVHGRYVLDEGGKMLGLRLVASAPDIPSSPLEASTPLAGFARFIERIALALLERLELPIDDALRQRINAVNRPTDFEAFRQVAQAQAAWSKGQNELALAAISSALSLDADYEEAITLEVAIARAVGDTVTVRDAFRRWSAVAVKRGRLRDGAERLMYLGHWLNERGEWTEARGAYEDAQSLYRRAADKAGMARALDNVANLDLVTGKLQAAIKTYRRSLRVFESDPGSQRDVAITLLNLGLAHKNLGQLEEALTAIERAMVLARQLKDVRLEARCLAQRGAIHDDLGEWAQAQADYARSAQLLDVVGDTTGVALVKSHQAVLLKQQGHYERAEALMLEALRAFEGKANPHEQAVLWLNLADLYFATQAYDQSWRFAGQAREVFLRLKSGWLEQADALLGELENLPEEPEPEETFPPVGGLDPHSDTGGSFSPMAPAQDEALYNNGNLYDNEYDNQASDGGDGDVNSGVGRTATM